MVGHPTTTITYKVTCVFCWKMPEGPIAGLYTIHALQAHTNIQYKSVSLLTG